jgi:hypothetical protein
MSCARTLLDRQSNPIVAINFFISTLVPFGLFPNHQRDTYLRYAM